jgi:hypothetical protein
MFPREMILLKEVLMPWGWRRRRRRRRKRK